MEKMKERKQQKESHKNEQTKRIINQKYINIKCEEKNQKNHVEKQIQKVVKQQIENKVKCQKGITLLALVITIIVLLILAGITINAITGDNGLIRNAGRAKEEAEIANEKEILEKATVQAMGNNKYGNIEEAELQEQLDKETGEGKTEATDIGEEFEVVFKESRRYYTIDKDGNVGEAQDIIEDKYPGDITVGTDGKTLAGTEAEPYEIWCIEDLVAFSNIVNGSGIKLENGEPVQVTTANRNSFSGKYIALKTNLNFKSKLSYQNSERTDFGDINGNADDGNTLMNEMTTGTGFKPIGLNNIFYGNFDGKDKETEEIYKISNLYINYENDTQLNNYGFGRSIGLFGTGHIQYTIIKNLEISGEIKGAGHTGGIIGQYANLIENCTNHANVTGYNMVGGIIGYSAQITNCTNTGDIVITGRRWGYGGAGGIIGNGDNVKNCINKGDISGNVTVGGIIGYNNSSDCKIDNCGNYGNVTLNGTSNQSAVGGILGYNTQKVEIKNTYNQGSILGNGTLAGSGGIVGASKGSANDSELILSIYNSFNTGEVIHENSIVGGIVGNQGKICAKNYIYIENCWTVGKNTDYGSMIGTINNDIINIEMKVEINYSYYTSGKSIGNMSKVDDENIVDNAIQKTENDIKTQEFVDLLNSYRKEGEQTYPTDWNKWKLGEEGYPAFE